MTIVEDSFPHGVEPVAQPAEASPHSVQLGRHPLRPDNAGEHVLAVAAHAVLDAGLGSGPGQLHGLETGHHALVHAPGPG